jgi:SAM-dependent methyltransferase
VRADARSRIISHARESGELFLISLLLLFLELACIRWFPAHVLFLTFFTNMVLLACFLGMSLGCLAANHRRHYLAWTPLLLAIAMGIGLAMESIRTTIKPVLGQASPQVVFFGTEDTSPGELDRLPVPMEVLAGVFFLLIALVMVGPGQELGRAFNRQPDRLRAYTWNILGSCAGIILFAVWAWLELPPLWWFLPIVLGCGWFILFRGTGAITRSAGHGLIHALGVIAPLVAILVMASWTTGAYRQGPEDLILSSTMLPEGTGEAEVESCLVGVGSEVKPGQPLMALKAGQSSFQLVSSGSGRIQTMRRTGDRIKAGDKLLTFVADQPGEHLWSPYYRIDFDEAPRLAISVNLIGHQTMVSRETSFAPAYALPHLLNRDAQSLAGQVAKPFEDVLVIGAGSGNDVSRALQWGAKHVDAVEIDPVIYRLGKDYHPDRPYQDERVTIHLADGRNFLRVTDRRYDLIVYALVDSLVLHSGYSNIRLESYLFTSEAFAEVRRRLKPGGLFVMYNAFRQGWIVSRLSRALEHAFETSPLPITYPYRESVHPDECFRGMTTFIAGEAESLKPLREAFRARPSYWLRNDQGPSPASPNGFEQMTTSMDQDRWEHFRPATVLQPAEPLRIPTDDWPFLYLRGPMIPDVSLRGAAVMGGLALLLLFLFSPNLLVPGGKGRTFYARMFFLGAGFMLVETRAVVNMALLFGSTWMVASVVFLAVLIMILAANYFVFCFRPQRLGLYYVGLLICLAMNLLIPLDAFLGLARGFQAVASCVLVFAPLGFAGVIFAVTLEHTPELGRAFGLNIAGAMVGGIAEYFSMLVGFQALICLAIGFYALSAITKLPWRAGLSIACKRASGLAGHVTGHGE